MIHDSCLSTSKILIAKFDGAKTPVEHTVTHPLLGGLGTEIYFAC